MTQFLKLIFNISLLLLIIVSVFPGSLAGLILYGDLERQPELIQNFYSKMIHCRKGIDWAY